MDIYGIVGGEISDLGSPFLASNLVSRQWISDLVCPPLTPDLTSPFFNSDLASSLFYFMAP